MIAAQCGESRCKLWEELASVLAEIKHRRPRIQGIGALEDECWESEAALNEMSLGDTPKIFSMKPLDLREFSEEYRTDLEDGVMDKRKLALRQLIDSALFDGEKQDLVSSIANLTGTNWVKVESPRTLTGPQALAIRAHSLCS